MLRRHAPALLLACALALTLLAVPSSAQTVEASTPIVDLDVIRHDAGTSDIRYDDTIVLDVNNDGEVGVGDLVLAGDYNGAYPGRYVDSSMPALIGHSNEQPAFVLFADIDFDGSYSSDDWVFLSYDDDTLPSSSASDTEYTLRLTDTGVGDFGTLARSPDSDRRTWETDVGDDLGGGAHAAAFTWADSDDDGNWDDGESAYLVTGATTDGQALPPLSILLTRGAPPSDPTTTTTSTTTTSTTSTTTTPTTTSTTTATTSTSPTSTTTTPATTPPAAQDPTGDGDDAGSPEAVPGMGAATMALAFIVLLAAVRRRLA